MLQIQSRYSGGQISLRTTQDPATSTAVPTLLPELPAHELDLSSAGNPDYEWSSVMLAFTDPYNMSQRELSSGCLLRLEYGLFLKTLGSNRHMHGRSSNDPQRQLQSALLGIFKNSMPFGILLLSTCKSSNNLAMTPLSLKLSLSRGDMKLLNAIEAANESLPVLERCSVKLASVKLRYRSFAPAARPTARTRTMTVQHYENDSEEDSDDGHTGIWGSDNDDEELDNIHGHGYAHYHMHPELYDRPMYPQDNMNSFIGAVAHDQVIAQDSCLYGFSIRSFVDVHNNVVAAVHHNPQQNSDRNPAKWRLDFSDCLVQLKHSNNSTDSDITIGDKRKRESTTVEVADDDDDSVVFMGFSSPSLVLPHVRENCAEHVFSVTGSLETNKVICDKCFCKYNIQFVCQNTFLIEMLCFCFIILGYICDAAASECPCWSTHCCAGSKGPLTSYWKNLRALWQKKRAEGIANTAIACNENKNVLIFDSGDSNREAAKLLADLGSGQNDVTFTMITLWSAEKEIEIVGLQAAVASLKSIPSEEYLFTVIQTVEARLSDANLDLEETITTTTKLLSVIHENFENFYDGIQRVFRSVISVILQKLPRKLSSNLEYVLLNLRSALYDSLISHDFSEELVQALIVTPHYFLSSELAKHIVSQTQLWKSMSPCRTAVRSLLCNAITAFEGSLKMEYASGGVVIRNIVTCEFTDLLSEYEAIILNDKSLSITELLGFIPCIGPIVKRPSNHPAGADASENTYADVSTSANTSDSARVNSSSGSQTTSTDANTTEVGGSSSVVVTDPVDMLVKKVCQKLLLQLANQDNVSLATITQFLIDIEAKSGLYDKLWDIFLYHADMQDPKIYGYVKIAVSALTTLPLPKARKFLVYIGSIRSLPSSAKPFLNQVMHAYAQRITAEVYRHHLTSDCTTNWKSFENILRMCGFTLKTVFYNHLAGLSLFSLSTESMDSEELFPIEGELINESSSVLNEAAIIKRISLFHSLRDSLMKVHEGDLLKAYKFHEAKWNMFGSKWVKSQHGSIFLLLLDILHTRAENKFNLMPPPISGSFKYSFNDTGKTGLTAQFIEFLRSEQRHWSSFPPSPGVKAAREVQMQIAARLPPHILNVIEIQTEGQGKNAKVVVTKKHASESHIAYNEAKSKFTEQQMLVDVVINCIKAKMALCPDLKSIEAKASISPKILATSLHKHFGGNTTQITIYLGAVSEAVRIQVKEILSTFTSSSLDNLNEMFEKLLAVSPGLHECLVAPPKPAYGFTSLVPTSQPVLSSSVLDPPPTISTQKETSSSSNVNMPTNMQKCKVLLTEIMMLPTSAFFLRPFDSYSLVEWPNYMQLISTPMDLSTVQKRVESNQFSSVDEFAQQVRLVFNNAIYYGTQRPQVPGATFRLQAAEDLLKQFNTKFTRVFGPNAQYNFDPTSITNSAAVSPGVGPCSSSSSALVQSGTPKLSGQHQFGNLSAFSNTLSSALPQVPQNTTEEGQDSSSLRPPDEQFIQFPKNFG